MRRKAHAAGCVVNTLSTNLSHQYKALWITDAQLAETFHNFCHSPRRYGSNVPGPLEARRRASKRKNTNLAFAGNAGAASYDAAVVLGSGPKDRWWKKFDVAVDTALRENGTGVKSMDIDPSSLSSSASSWLSKTMLRSPMFPHSPSSNLQQSKEESYGYSDPIYSGRTENEYRARIAQARNPESVRDVMKRLNISLRQHASLCTFAFQHLMEIYEAAGNMWKLAPALHDPLLNPPESHNHQVFLKHFQLKPCMRRTWDLHISPALITAVRLGLVSPKSLRKIIIMLPDILKAVSTIQVNHRTHIEFDRLVTAIEESRVLSLNYLGSEFLAKWFHLVDKAYPVDANELTCTLLWRLRDGSGKAEIDLASDLVVRRFSTPVEETKGLPQKLPSWLSNLPSTLQGPVLIQTTFKMIAAAQDDKPQAHDMLKRWSAALPYFHFKKLDEFCLDRTTWLEAFSVAVGLTHVEQLLVVIWLATRMSAEQAQHSSYLASPLIRQEFERLFNTVKDTDQFDHISQLILALDTVPLPDKNHIFGFLQHVSDGKVLKMLGNPEYLDGLNACFRLEYALLRDNRQVSQARFRWPEVLRSLTESINNDLAQFTRMAQILILKDKENFRMIRRLISYNAELRYAAMQSWPHTTTAERVTADGRPDLDPSAVLSMLETLIMTFAVTPVASPRSAFAQVYKMYKLLHRIGAPINPIVARALWHAGVTRYEQAGAPRAQVRWCLSKVREAEGNEVADRLLRSAAFRQSFVNEFRASLQRIKPGSVPSKASVPTRTSEQSVSDATGTRE